MARRLTCLALLLIFAGCWTTRRVIQDGTVALLVNPVSKPDLMPPPLPTIKFSSITNRPPPKPYTNLFLVWNNGHPLNSFQAYSRTSLSTGRWQLKTSYYPCLTGELRMKFTNNMTSEFFLLLWTNLSYGVGGVVLTNQL